MKIKSLFLILGIVIFTSSSCVKTPENTEIKSTTRVASIDSEESKTLTDSELITKTTGGIIEKWTEEFSRSSSSFYIDAAINIPKLPNGKIVSVAPKILSVDETNHLLSVLYPNTKIYDEINFSGELMSKSEIEDNILQHKQTISEVKKEDISEEEKSNIIQHLEQMIADLELKYPDAPVTIEFPEIEINESRLSEGLVCRIRDNNTNEDKGRIFISSTTEENGKAYNLLFGFTVDHSHDNTNLSVDESSDTYTEEDAINISLEKLRELNWNEEFNLDQSVYVENGVDSSYYEIFFVKKYYGINESYFYRNLGFEIFSDEQFEFVWRPEYIVIRVRNNKIVDIRWEAPTQIISETDEEISLISFEQIKEIFKKQIEIQEIWIPEESYVESRKIHIKEIQLNVMKIKTISGSYEMVPVWDFIGFSIDKYREQEPGGHLLDDNMEYQENDLCFMTINATNGDIVDRTRGY